MKDQVNYVRENVPAWPMVPISDIADHCLGKMLDKHKNKGTLKPYLRNLNVRWFEFDTSDILEMRFEDHETERYQARKGDLIVCEGGYPGRAAIWQDKEPVYIQKALHRVRFHEPERAKWVLYWLHLNDLSGSLSEAFSGTGIQHFTKTALARFKVPLPPLEEQKRIVAVLDQAFAALDRARAHAEANLVDVSLFLTSSVKANIDILGEEHGLTVLGDVADFRNGFAFKSQKFSSKGQPVVRISNITKGEVDLQKVVYSRQEDYSEDLSRYHVEPGDLLIAMSGATTGKIGFNKTDQVLLQNQRVGRFVPTKQLSLDYLAYFLDTKVAENLAISAGAAQPNLSSKQIREIRLPIPPRPVQDAFVEKQDSLRGMVQAAAKNYREGISSISDLRQSLLQKAFSGQLTA